MDQDNQKTSGIEQSQSMGFDEGVFDELWDVATKTSANKGGDDVSPLASLGALDWGELENDNDLWSGLEAEALTKQKAPSEEETASVTADKAHDLAKSLFSDSDDVVVSHRSKSQDSSDGKNNSEITVRVRASSILNDVEKAVAQEKDALDAVTLTSMASVSELESSILADDPFESSSIVDVTKSDDADAHSASENEALEDVGGVFEELAETEAKSEETEAKFEETEAKSEETEAKAEETEAKAEETEAKAEETEVKSEETEVKSEETEVKSEKTEAKAEETDAKAEETEAKAEETEAKAEETEAKAEETEAKSEETEEELNVKSLLAEESDEESSADEEDSEDGGVILSERARMGRFIPEGEVVTSEHELKNDTYYDDEVCEPEPVVVENKAIEHRGLILLCAVLLSILVGVFIYAIYVYITKPADVMYAQQVVFTDDVGSYQRISTSSDGRFVVMCSDGRGVVHSNGKKVSEFWPTEAGCRDIRISEDGKVVWFVGRDKSLFAVNLEADSGFNPTKLGTLEDKYMNGFDVVGNKVVYAALSKEDGVTRIIRTLDLQTKKAEDEVLPGDAFICDGIFAEGYTYLSDGSIHTIRNKIKESASLDTPKLGCRLAPNQKGCTSDRSGNWAVLCTDSLRQGKGKSADAPQQLPDDPAIRAGSKKFELLRNASGTDFITTNYSYSIDKSNKLSHVEFSPKLSESFSAVRLNDKNRNLLVINDKTLAAVNSDGRVGTVAYLAQNQIIGSEFVSDGNRVAVFALSATGTQVALWSLSEAALLRTQEITGIANSVNISDKGRYGFVVTNENGKSILHWMEWNTINAFGKIELSRDITNAIWSDDEKYALIQYEDKSWELYERGENTMRLMRSYPAGVHLSFAQNGMLWRVENGHLMNEQIGTGKLSVNYNALDDALAEIEVSGVVAHPHANDVVLWGNKGLLTLKLDSSSRRANSISLDKPVTWCVPDRYGKYMATSAGLFDLETAVIHPYNTQINEPLSWIGSSNYLMSADGRMMLDVRLPEKINSISMAHKNAGLSTIGANSGFHPSANLLSVIRDGSVSIEMLNENSVVSTLAVFSSLQSEKWCWANAAGQRQGKGGLCTFTAQDSKLNVAAQFEDGVASAPVSTKLKRDSREFTAYITADGYETRTITFTPEMAKLDLRVALQPEGSSNIATVWFDSEETENAEITMSEDTNIEFNALVYADKSTIKHCIDLSSDGVVSLDLNAQSVFVVPEGTEEAVSTCMAPFVTKLQEARQNGALPELTDMINVRAVIVIL